MDIKHVIELEEVLVENLPVGELESPTVCQEKPEP